MTCSKLGYSLHDDRWFGWASWSRCRLIFPFAHGLICQYIDWVIDRVVYADRKLSDADDLFDGLIDSIGFTCCFFSRFANLRTR